jgi:hypothetical protein
MYDSTCGRADIHFNQGIGMAPMMIQDGFGRGISEAQVHAGTALSYHFQTAVQVTPRHKLVRVDFSRQHDRCDALLHEMPQLVPRDQNFTASQLFGNLGWKVEEGVPYTAWTLGSSFSNGHFWDQSLLNQDIPHAESLCEKYCAVAYTWVEIWEESCALLDKELARVSRVVREKNRKAYDSPETSEDPETPEENHENGPAAEVDETMSPMLPDGDHKANLPPAHTSATDQAIESPVESLPGPSMDHPPPPPPLASDAPTTPLALDDGATVLVYGTPTQAVPLTQAVEPTPPVLNDVATVLVYGTPSQAVPLTQATEPDDSIQSWVPSTAPDQPVDDPISSWDNAEAATVGQ